MNLKYLLMHNKKPWMALFVMLTSFVFGQGPSLELAAGGGNPTGNGAVLTTTVNFQKNTDNATTGTAFATYAPTLSATYTISNSRFTTSLNSSTTQIGQNNAGATTIMGTMDIVGSPANANFTSTGVASNGNGIVVSSNTAVRMFVIAAPLRVNNRATNGTHAMADLTVTFNRPVNNPVIHLAGLGGQNQNVNPGPTLGFAARLDIASSNVPLANLSLTRLSGNDANGFQTSGLGIFDNATTITATGAGSGSGSVRINGTGITSLTFTVSLRGDGGDSATTGWATSDTSLAGDAFTLGFSLAESDLQVTNTVNTAISAPGATRTFTITATNAGASNNTNVSVQDLLPSGYTYVSSTASTGTYDPVTGLWSIGNLNDQASATLTITATVNASGNYSNTATISTTSGIGDPNSVNNSASASINIDSDGDNVPDNIDLDDDNDGILDTNEGCTATVTMSSIGATTGTQIQNLITNNTALFPVTGVPLTQGGVRVTRNSGGNAWQAFTPSISTATIAINGVTTAPFSTTYLDLIDQNATVNQVPRNLTIDFGQPANSLNTASNSYQYIIGIAGLGGEGTTTITNTFSVPLTVAANFNVFNNGIYSTFNGVTPPVVGATNTVFSTNTANTSAQGYTYFLVPADVAAFTMNLTGTNDRHGMIFGVYTTSCSTDTDGDGIPNSLDLDSDNDGCPDVIEGAASFTNGATYISNMRLNTGSVSATGIPQFTTPPAGYSNATGQTIGGSQNAAATDPQNECTPAIGCNPNLYLVQSSTLYNVGTTANPFVYTSQGVTPGFTYNAIGINPINGRMYGMQSSSNNLVEVASNGIATVVGSLTGLPTGVTPTPTYTSGEFDNLGNYYIRANGSNSLLYRVNLNNLTVTPINLTSSSSGSTISISTLDLAYRVTNGLLYTVDTTGQFMSINPTTGVVTNIGAPTTPSSFGAMFASSTGEIYGADNGVVATPNSGGFYQFNITNGARTLLSTAPSSSLNDGAHCVTSPITFTSDLAITITDGNTNYIPGTTVTYTVVATTNGPTGVSGATVSIPLPAGIPSGNVTYTVATANGATSTVTSGTGAITDTVNIPSSSTATGTVTYTVTVVVPTTYTGDLTATATITAPSNITDTNTANNTATDVDNLVDAKNDINQTPVNVAVTGSVIRNDYTTGATIVRGATQGATTIPNTNVATQVAGVNSLGVAVANAGTLQLNSNGNYTFTPATGFVGTVNVTYSIGSSTATADTANLEIQVVPSVNTYLNNAPVALNDTGVTKMNTPLLVTQTTVLANDSDPDGNTLTVSAANQSGTNIPLGGTTGTVVAGRDISNAVVANAGTLILNTDGTYSFTPANNFVGTIDPVTYTVRDGNGGNDTAVLNLEVKPTSALPVVFANDDAKVTRKGVSTSGTVLGNDSTTGGGTLSVTSVTINGTAYALNSTTTSTSQLIPGVGTVTMNTNGNYTFAPDANYVGTTTVPYTVCNNLTPQSCSTATLYLTSLDTSFLDAKNDINQTPFNTPITAGSNVSVLLNDVSSTTPATTVTVGAATYRNASGAFVNLPLGTATTVYAAGATGVSAGSLTLNANGTYTFTPTTGFVGTVDVNYTAVNTSGNSDPALLQIKVLPAVNATGNNPPVALNDTGVTKATITLNSNVLGNDSDPDIANTISVTGATQGATTIVTTGTGTAIAVAGVDAAGNAVTNAGTFTLGQSGAYTFAPNGGFVGTVNPITYTIGDGQGGASSAVLNIEVKPSTAPPVVFANDDAKVTLKGVPVSGIVATNDTNSAGGGVVITQATINGTNYNLLTAPVVGLLVPNVGTISINNTGAYTFTPLANYVGTYPIPYVASNLTNTASSPAVLYLTSLDGQTYCYRTPAINAGTLQPVKHGITALNRAGSGNTQWPTVRQSAWTVLEAKTKGFVVNRMAFAGGNPVGITAGNYVEGMMVYDTTNNCLKVYTSTDGGTTFAWYCMTTQACPN